MNKFKSIFQSIGAVIAGYLVSAVLTGLTIAALGVLFPVSYNPENTAWVVFNVIYGCAFAVIGGYVAARLAPARPWVHATILGLLMAVFAVITGYAVSVAPPSPEYANQPGWYYPVLAITVLPSILLGAWLYVRGANKPSLVRQNTQG
jgi:heme A synthase